MVEVHAGISFPVLGFTSDGDVWGFPSQEELSVCGPQTLAENRALGMELIDATGRRFIVRSVRRTGSVPHKSLLNIFTPKLNRIALDLEEATAVTLSDAKARVCAAMDAFPEFWCEEDERDTVLRERQREVRSATSFAAIHEKIGLDWFADY